MDTSVYIVFVLGVAVVLGLLLVAAIVLLAPMVDPMLHRGARARAFGEIAERKGLRFDRNDRYRLSSLPLDLVRNTEEPVCQNVVSSGSGGRDYRIFDLVESGVTGRDTCALATI